MPVERLRNGEKIIGTMVSMVRSPAIALMAREAGLDYFMLDMEHSPHSYETLAGTAAAAMAAGIGCFVRVPEMSRGYISRALDCGATGVMVPMVETVEQARMFASWAKYPPMGKRGLGSIGGQTGYRKITDFCDFMTRANRNTLTIAQIETVRGAETADLIAEVEGIDALLIGPLDLSVSCGDPGNFATHEHQKAIGKVAEAARKNGKVFGIHGGEPLLEEWMPHGLRLVMNSLDVNMLASGMQGIRKWFEGLE
ncbi:MAG: HpcH/HpaI aldolase family protein [Candidatus Latescibacterota bacterium]